MSANEIAEALERLRQNLPKTPDWIAIATVYGMYCAGIGNLPEKDRVATKSAALEGMGERLAGEFGLGNYRFQIIMGDKGFILEALIEEDNYVLSMQFGKETSFASMAIIESVLPSLLEDLKQILRENPL